MDAVNTLGWTPELDEGNTEAPPVVPGETLEEGPTDVLDGAICADEDPDGGEGERTCEKVSDIYGEREIDGRCETVDCANGVLKFAEGDEESSG